MSVFGCNQEGYPDPTAAEAIAKASKKKICRLSTSALSIPVMLLPIQKQQNGTADSPWARMPYTRAAFTAFLLYERRVRTRSWPCL